MEKVCTCWELFLKKYYFPFLEAIDALVKRHGEIARKSWFEGGKQGVVQKWDLDNHYNAAFVFYGVQDRNQYQVDLNK